MRKLIVSITLILIHIGMYGQENKIESTGDVGIGTITPLSKLHVEGRAIVGRQGVLSLDWTNETNWAGNSNKWSGYIGFNAYRTNNEGKDLYYGRNKYTSKGVFEGSNYGFRWLFRDRNNNDSDGQHLLTEYMRLSNTGNLGIGTASPKSKLQVAGGASNWGESVQGLHTGSIHLNPADSSDHFGNAITFGASDAPGGDNAQAGIYVRTDGSYGTKMYFSTTDAYVAGSKTAMAIDNKGRIGIGTITPASKLQISGGAGNWNESVQGLSTGSIHLDPANSSDHFGNSITFGASDASGGTNAQAGIYVRTDGSYGTKMYFSTTDAYVAGSKTAMTIDHKGRIGVGTNTPDSKLAVNGVIHAREVKVDLVGWPDYVFENTYQLPTLAQVETHIKEKGHLQNIPSAQEVAENGIQLGEMNKKLLEKIEELTLYTIQQQKEIEDLKEIVAKLIKQ